MELSEEQKQAFEALVKALNTAMDTLTEDDDEDDDVELNHPKDEGVVCGKKTYLDEVKGVIKDEYLNTNKEL